MSEKIQDQIAQEKAEARAVCDVKGGSSPECAAAWDVVEELQAEASHQKQKEVATHKTTLQQYCDDNPDALECRVYDN